MNLFGPKSDKDKYLSEARKCKRAGEWSRVTHDDAGKRLADLQDVLVRRHRQRAADDIATAAT